MIAESTNVELTTEALPFAKLAVSRSVVNRWRISNFDLEVGEYVVVPLVRTQKILDRENGLGWWANDVIVKVTKVMDLTFCFELNGEIHYALKDNVKRTKQRPNLFNEQDKINYAKDDLNYRLRIKYGC